MVPQFKGCPFPKHKPGSAEQNAKISMVYFHPWTLREACISSVIMEVCFFMRITDRFNADQKSLQKQQTMRVIQVSQDVANTLVIS